MKYLYIVLMVFVSTSISAQCLPDRHSTSWFDAWVSCDLEINPNPEHNASHWIMYDLKNIYKLGESHFWNINDPSHLDRGLYKATIDLSFDGVNWMFADSLILSQGPGKSVYEGEEGPDLNGAQARYVLITIHESHGDTECFGFSELRMARERLTTNTDDLAIEQGCLRSQASPNPFQDNSLLTVKSTCEGDVDWILTNVLGQIIRTGQIDLVDGQGTFEVSGEGLDVGQHLLSIRQGENTSSVILGKVK